MIRAHVDHRAQLREAELSGEIRLDMLRHTSKLPPRQAADHLVPGPAPRGNCIAHVIAILLTENVGQPAGDEREALDSFRAL